MLFGPSFDLDFYNYCPSIKVEDNIIHVWYCTNKESGNITDYIGYRQGKYERGTYVFGDETLVLAPSPGTWDARHVCDPSVIKGVFHYNGEEYHYLMAYLGCVSDNCTDNETGIALAKKIEGPWVKCGTNPLIPFINSIDYKTHQTDWGYGQPSVISLDKKGEVIIFYTVGTKTTFTRAEWWDLSNVNNPLKKGTTDLKNDGYINKDNMPDVIGNADFAYDPVAHTLYAVSDMRGKRLEEPRYISDAFPVLRAKLNGKDLSTPPLFNSDYTWEVLAVIGQNETGYPKNHNPGLLSDIYGHLSNPATLTCAYTTSDLARRHPDRVGIWTSLHTYRISTYFLSLQGGPTHD